MNEEPKPNRRKWTAEEITALLANHQGCIAYLLAERNLITNNLKRVEYAIQLIETIEKQLAQRRAEQNAPQAAKLQMIEAATIPNNTTKHTFDWAETL